MGPKMMSDSVRDSPSLACVFGAKTAEEGGVQGVCVSVEQGERVACNDSHNHCVSRCGNHSDSDGCARHIFTTCDVRLQPNFTCQQKGLHQRVADGRADAAQARVQRRLQQRPFTVLCRRPLLV